MQGALTLRVQLLHLGWFSPQLMQFLGCSGECNRHPPPRRDSVLKQLSRTDDGRGTSSTLASATMAGAVSLEFPQVSSPLVSLLLHQSVGVVPIILLRRLRSVSVLVVEPLRFTLYEVLVAHVVTWEFPCSSFCPPLGVVSDLFFPVLFSRWNILKACVRGGLWMAYDAALSGSLSFSPSLSCLTSSLLIAHPQ